MRLVEILNINLCDFKRIQRKYSIEEFELEVLIVDWGEGIHLHYNEESLSSNFKQILQFIHQTLDDLKPDDYIRITIYSTNNCALYKHENQIKNYKANSLLALLENELLYPNYLDANTKKWWEEEA